MRLHILGSGSCLISQKDRNSAGYALEMDERTVLIDTGPGVSDALATADLDIESIDLVLSTHRHPDHVSDLIPILQNKVVESIYYGKNESKDLTFLGPKGHQKYVRSRLKHEMDETIDGINTEFPFGFSVGSFDSTEPEGFELETIPVEHAGESFPCRALKISLDGKTIVFTGDTDYFEDLIEFAKEADILVTDCSMPDEKKVDGHMTPSECGRLAENADVGCLVLSHLYPDTDSYDLVSSAEEVFDGSVRKAEDFMVLDI